MVDQLVVGFDLDMTLIDTAPGFRDVLAALGAELGVEFPVEEMTRSSARRSTCCSSPTSRPTRSPPPATGSARCTPTTPSPGRPRSPAPHEALAAVRRHGGRVLVVTGKYPANAQLHLDHLALDVDHLEGWVWGVGKAEVLRREGASIYVGDHIHDVEGALAAGALSVSVLTGGCTREELLAAGTDVVLDGLDEFPAWLDEHVLSCGSPPSRPSCASAARCWSRSAAAPTAPSCSRPRSGARAGATSPRRPATPTRCPPAERDPAREFAESLGVRVLTPETHEMEREGYRANGGDRCYFCKAELLDVLARSRRARPGPRRDRHERRRRGGGLPAGHPRRRRARRDHAAARRRADQGAGARGLAALGAADLGQARGRLPVVAGRLRRRGDAVAARPRGARGGRRTPAAGRRRPLADLRVRDLGDRASVELDAALLPLAGGPSGLLTPCARRASTPPRSTRAASAPAR